MSGRRPPDTYAEIDRWIMKTASVKERLLAVSVGIVAFVASLVVAIFIVGTATGTGEVTIGGGTFLLGMVVGLVLGVVAHEAVHGFLFLVFGGSPRFGFKPWTKLGPVFYAAAPGSYFSKAQYLAAGMAPALLLTVALAIALVFVAAHTLLVSVVTWAFVLNVSGSAGTCS